MPNRKYNYRVSVGQLLKLLQSGEVAGTPLVNQNWYNYNACTKFSTNETVFTMIWGTLWDMIMEFVSTRADKKPVSSMMRKCKK